jgi:hypothetical protein
LVTPSKSRSILFGALTFVTFVLATWCIHLKKLLLMMWVSRSIVCTKLNWFIFTIQFRLLFCLYSSCILNILNIWILISFLLILFVSILHW